MRLINPDQTDRFRAIFQKNLADRHAAGDVDEHSYKQGVHASNSDKVVHELINRASTEGDFSWVRIEDWMKDHWLDVLKIALSIISIAVLFMEPEPGKENTNGHAH